MNKPWKTEISERIQFSNRKNRPLQVCLLGLTLSLAALSIQPSRAEPPNDNSGEVPPLELFFQAGAAKDEPTPNLALEALGRSWRDCLYGHAGRAQLADLP